MLAAAIVHNILGRKHADARDRGTAQAEWDAALQLYDQLGNRVEAAIEVAESLAEIALINGDFEVALRTAVTGRRLAQSLTTQISATQNPATQNLQGPPAPGVPSPSSVFQGPSAQELSAERLHEQRRKTAHFIFRAAQAYVWRSEYVAA